MLAGKPEQLLMPIVSVVIPTRNRAELLTRAIKSVLAQSFSDWELVVIDDASTDHTQNVLIGYATADSRIKIRRCSVPNGAAAARNIGIEAARGDYVAFLDDDDEWLPDKLERQLEWFRSVSHEVGVVYGSFFEVLASGTERLRGTTALPTDGQQSALLHANVIGHSTIMVQRSMLKLAGGYNARLPRLQDWDLWIRLASRTKFAHMPAPVARIYHTPQSISTNSEKLLTACEILLANYDSDPSLHRNDLAGLTFELGRLLVLNERVSEGRRLMWRSLGRDPRHPRRLMIYLLSLLSPGIYQAIGNMLPSLGRFRRIHPVGTHGAGA